MMEHGRKRGVPTGCEQQAGVVSVSPEIRIRVIRLVFLDVETFLREPQPLSIVGHADAGSGFARRQTFNDLTDFEQVPDFYRRQRSNGCALVEVDFQNALTPQARYPFPDRTSAPP